MTSSTVLPSVPQVLPGDCLAYAIAVVGHLYSVSPSVAAGWLGLPVRAAISPLNIHPLTPHQAADASARLGVTSQTLASMTAVPWSKTQLLAHAAPIFRPAVVNKHAHHAAVPICPECLSQRPTALRFLWRFPALPVCLEHGLILQRQCANPTCTKPIRSAAGAITTSPKRPHCATPINAAEATPISSIRDLRSAARAVAEEMDEQNATGLPRTVRLDLVAVQDLVTLLLRTHGPSTANATIVDAEPHAIAAVLPLAVRLAQSQPRRVWPGHLQRLRDVPAQTWRGYRELDDYKINVKVLALMNEAIFREQGPAVLISYNRGLMKLSCGRFPAMLSTEIFNLELADLLHDALTAIDGQAPEFDTARKVAALLCVTWYRRGGSQRGTPEPQLAALAAAARDSAEALGLGERLDGACLRASLLTLSVHSKRLRSFDQAPHEVLAHGRWLGVPEADIPRWLAEEYLCCGLDALPEMPALPKAS